MGNFHRGMGVRAAWHQDSPDAAVTVDRGRDIGSGRSRAAGDIRDETRLNPGGKPSSLTCALIRWLLVF